MTTDIWNELAEGDDPVVVVQYVVMRIMQPTSVGFQAEYGVGARENIRYPARHCENLEHAQHTKQYYDLRYPESIHIVMSRPISSGGWTTHYDDAFED